MNEDQKKKYIEMMNAKAIAFAESELSDVKRFISKEQYEDTFESLADSFLRGANAAIETIKEIKGI